MPRHALRAFFQRAVLLAPLALPPGCDPFGGGCPVVSTHTVGIPVDGGLPDALDVDACNELCHSQEPFVQVRACAIAGPPDGGVQPLACTIAQPCEGRRPAGFTLRGSRARRV